VREALRILEAEGLIETRPGRRGGSRVRRPPGDVLAHHLELFFWGRNSGLEDLHDVLKALEALAAQGAARRRSNADIRGLTEKTAALEASVHDADAYLAAHLQWHMAIVRASHNRLAAIVEGDADAAWRRSARDVAAPRQFAAGRDRAHRDSAPRSAPEAELSPDETAPAIRHGLTADRIGTRKRRSNKTKS